MVVSREDKFAGALRHVKPMIGANKFSASHLPEVEKSRGHLPQTNWSEHATAFECIPSMNKFMCSNFFYSLESQKPRRNRETSGRSINNIIPVNAQNLAPQQIEKAWSARTNLSINNTYLRPGITPAIDYSSTNCSSSTRGRSTVKVTSNADGSFYAPSHQAHSEKSVTGTTRSFDRYSSSSPADGKLTAGKVPWVNDEVGGCKYINGMEIVPMRNSAVPARQVEPREASLGVIDDDDIRKYIDVDEIVMEHYQSTCTSQPSVSEFPQIAPSGNIFASKGEEKPCLPPELYSNCSHGVKLGICLEASTHVEQMKDALLAISHELLDDSTDLSPDHFQQLCQERLLLIKQIQQLETLIHSKERKKSSTPTHNFQYETPQTTNRKVNFAQTDSGAHVKEQSRYASDNWNMPKDHSFSEDRSGLSSDHVERERYVPKIIDVTYTDGSNDKKWSSRDFPWTKNLEVNNKRVFGNHSFRPNQREIINATMSGCDVFVLMPTGGGKRNSEIAVLS